MQLLGRIVIAISLIRQANVIINVIFKVCQLAVWNATGIVPIAKTRGPGKTDDCFDL